MDLIDTHCHLNDPAFSAALPEVIARAQAAGVGRFVVPAYDLASLERTAQLAEAYRGIVFPAYGLHPWYIDESFDPEQVRPYLRRADAVAVGEIGLDLSPECPPADLQVRALVSQLDMAAEFNLPVLLHCRKAYDSLYGILKPYQGRLSGVLHSYAGGAEGLARFVALGFYISFSGSVTRSNARKYHRTAAIVPLDRFLLETDAPSIATESMVASAVEPRHVLEVARKIADLRGLPLAEVGRLSTENTLRLFSRIPPA
ncbi:MAG: TatD family hydrolase [Deltaproteobacteria bacterium]|nr:TatD family hydrolase [Deltaproteobacteria bacterium]